MHCYGRRFIVWSSEHVGTSCRAKEPALRRAAETVFLPRLYAWSNTSLEESQPDVDTTTLAFHSSGTMKTYDRELIVSRWNLLMIGRKQRLE